MNISEELKNQAIAFNLCDDWTKNWGTPNKDLLVRRYINGIDFCIQHDFPSVEYIKKHFTGIAEKYGVYTDEKDLNINKPNIAILNGSCDGVITLSDYVSCDIYIRHSSNIRIVIKDHAKAFIRIFDDSNVVVENESDSRVFVYKYVDRFKGKVLTTGNVLIRERSFNEL